MSRHLAPQMIGAALSRGTYVEQFLGGSAVDGQPSIRWLMLQKGADDDDYEVSDDFDGEEDETDDDVFILKYYEVLDEGSESWVDVYEFPPVSGDPDDQGEPVTRHWLGTLEEALALAVERYGADPGRFVNQTMIGHEYHDYVLRGRR
jgi:hypothetical protein